MPALSDVFLGLWKGLLWVGTAANPQAFLCFALRARTPFCTHWRVCVCGLDWHAHCIWHHLNMLLYNTFWEKHLPDAYNL